jgi:exodeoxyribonuclease VII large subunit
MNKTYIILLIPLLILLLSLNVPATNIAIFLTQLRRDIRIFFFNHFLCLSTSLFMTNESVLSVSDVTRAIQRTFEASFDTIVMQGEISNYKHHASGHRYFTLKDSTAQISATMWRSTTIHFEPRDGMSVIVSGKITMFPPQGRVQIECRTMRPIGQGDLYRAFEELKQHLARLGYFDQTRKRALPAFPATIGIATSASGAALKDILATLQRRMPLVSVLVRPTIVQGEAAPIDIANAIADLNESDCDVMIVGRGGGSIEDLWAFNTPIVAEAIYQSSVPIISAVGHETDFTIADFVADAGNSCRFGCNRTFSFADHTTHCA